MASPNKKAYLLRLRPEIYEALSRWADDEFRSFNSHVEYLLLESLRKAGRKPKPPKKPPPTNNPAQD